jgi:predicted metal-dependent hydrolase
MAFMQRLLQYTLDMFDPAPPVPEKARIKRAIVPKKKPAGRVEPPVPQATERDLWRGEGEVTAFRHPRASRELQLGEALVAYEFKRGKRRTIGFSVGPDGLVVSAPRWTPLYEVDNAVREKSAWILTKLSESRLRLTQLESTRIEWRNGASLPFRGEPMLMVLDPSHDFGAVGAQLRNDAPDACGATRCTLHIALAQHASAEQIRDAVQAWLMRQAREIFTERLNHFAPQLEVQWQRLSLSNAGTRWGSARSDGSIRLNWRLIHFKPSVLDYVVAHELSHLRVMNHSARFWATVGTVVPDYAQLRGQLKDVPVPRW